MTFKILKSVADQIDPDFASAVEKHRQELLDHRFSPPAQGYIPAVPGVSATPDIPAVKGTKYNAGRLARKGTPAVKEVPAVPARPGVPRPQAHPLIEGCIKRLPGDGKSPDNFIADYVILDDSPTLRQRKDALLGKIGGQEKEKRDAIWPPGKQRADMIKYEKIKAKGKTDQSPDEAKFKKEIDDKVAALTTLGERAADLMSEIEDLTDVSMAVWNKNL